MLSLFLARKSYYHSLANMHSCLTPAENERIDINNAGLTAEGMINQQTTFVYRHRGQHKQKYSWI